MEIPPTSSDEMTESNFKVDTRPFEDPFALGVSCEKGTMYPETCELCKHKLLTKESRKSGQCVHCRKDTLMQTSAAPNRTLRMEDHYKTNPPWGGKL